MIKGVIMLFGACRTPGAASAMVRFPKVIVTSGDSDEALSRAPSLRLVSRMLSSSASLSRSALSAGRPLRPPLYAYRPAFAPHQRVCRPRGSSSGPGWPDPATLSTLHGTWLWLHPPLLPLSAVRCRWPCPCWPSPGLIDAQGGDAHGGDVHPSHIHGSDVHRAGLPF